MSGTSAMPTRSRATRTSTRLIPASCSLTADPPWVPEHADPGGVGTGGQIHLAVGAAAGLPDPVIVHTPARGEDEPLPARDRHVRGDLLGEIRLIRPRHGVAHGIAGVGRRGG